MTGNNRQSENGCTYHVSFGLLSVVVVFIRAVYMQHKIEVEGVGDGEGDGDGEEEGVMLWPEFAAGQVTIRADF